MYSTKPGGDSATYTPFHFPLLVSDNVGESVLSLHAAQSQAHGIDDHDSHQTYAQFIRMNHWELVLKQRFDDGRPRGGFASKRDEALTVLLDCSMEHVKRLRSWWLGLLNGRRISLKKELETHKTNRIHTRLGRGDQEALIV